MVAIHSSFPSYVSPLWRYIQISSLPNEVQYRPKFFASYEAVYVTTFIYRQDIQQLRLENEILEERLASYALNGAGGRGSKAVASALGPFMSSESDEFAITEEDI